MAWDNPEQKFKTEYEFVRDEKAIAKYGIKVLDISMVGCTSQGQAQRAGLWALKSEQLETRTVTFKTGLDGFIPTVGSIINVSDEVLAGRANGGRVAAVSADLLTVTVDRDVAVSVGDTLIVNADNGKAQRRIVSAVNGRNVTVSVAFDGVSSQNVWAVDSSDLKTMRFRVLSIKQDDVTFTITALQHEPQKYDAIDYGAIVEPTAISIIKPNIIDAPKNIVITQRNRVEQGQSIATMIVSWEQVSGAVAYDVEWRKDNGNWIKVPRTGNNSIEIDGVYSGNYLARVAAVSTFDLVSNFAASALTAVTGKVGAPPTLANLKATGILFGMRLDWLFAQGSSDTNYTEIQVASAPDTNVALLGVYAYPTNTATINGLQGNLTQYYRARIVDKLGNVSPWTAWVKGVTSADAQKVLDLLNGQITESQLYQGLGAKIGKIGTIETGLSNEIKNRVDAIKSVDDGITQEIIDRKNGDTETLGVITTYKKSNDTAMAAVQDEIKTVVGNQSAMSTKLDGVYAVVTPLTADSDQWTADSGSKAAASWTLQSAIVDGDRVISERIDTVQTTVNGNTASIQTQQQSINGLYAQYTVKVDVNGRVSGFGLASSDTQSDFAIRADKFYIAPPEGTSKGDSPFMVLTSPQVINGVTVPVGTYIKGDLIATGSISGDKITAKTEINAPIIKGGSININDKFIVKENGDLIGKSGTFEGTVLADKISGTIDVESLKKSAWLAGYKCYVSLGQVGNYAISNVPRMYSSRIVSLGSLVYSLGNNNFDVGAILFEIKVNVQNPTTVNQNLLIVDDYVDLIVNDVQIGTYGTGRVNKPISFNLTSGINTIQWLLRNTNWGTATIVLLGDFIDNQNIKFA